MAGALQVTLERDGHDQPWGFRLQGGSDVSLPLSVQRVLVGTPSDNLLKKGDVILRISQTDAKGMSHQAAADLFNNAGNQITVVIRRAGVIVPPSVAPASAPAAPVSGDTLIEGGVQVLPPKPDPYRTMPIIQPSPKIQDQLGPGSTIHLKMQGEHITGIKEPVPVNQNQINRERGNELLMKQKVTGSLQQIQTQQTLSSVTSQHHSEQQIQETYLTKRTDVSTLIEESPAVQVYTPEETKSVNMDNTGPLINPVNKPSKHMMPRGLARTYDPENSDTWQVINELENCQLVTEHGPTESKVYSI